MADDAVNRGLTAEQANPFLDVDTLKYLGDEVNVSPLLFLSFNISSGLPRRVWLNPLAPPV